MDDLISRQAAIDALGEDPGFKVKLFGKSYDEGRSDQWFKDVHALTALPSAEPTLYGYKIEHLAYIAKVMEEEGVTAEYAVRTFDDMSRVIRMIIEEAQQKAEEALDKSFGHLMKTGNKSKDSQQ